MTHDCATKKDRKKEELGYRTDDKREKWRATSNEVELELLQVIANKFFFSHHDAWRPIFPPRRQHVDSTQSLSCHLPYMMLPRLFFFFPWPASPVWPTRDCVKVKNTPNFRGLKETLCANYLTPAVLDHTAATCTGRKATFPVKPIKLYSNGPDLLLSFFFSRLLLCNKT